MLTNALRLPVLCVIALGAYTDGPAAQVAPDHVGDPLPVGAIARLGTPRWRQPEVWTLCYSADGKTLASGGADGVVRLWDAQTGREHRRVTGFGQLVNSVAFAGDGNLVAAAGQNKVVAVWNWRTGKRVFAIRDHKADVCQLGLAPDARLLAFGGADSVVRVWDLNTGEEVHALPGPKGHLVYAIAFCPTGKRIAIGRTDGDISVWDVNTWKRRQGFRGHTASVKRLAFSPDGTRVYSAGLDKTVRCWDVATGAELGRYGAESEQYQCLALSSNGELLAAGTVGGRIVVWETSTAKQIASWRGDSRPNFPEVACLAFAPKARVIASAAGNTVGLWDPATGKRLNPTDGYDAPVSALVFAPDGGQLSVGSGSARDGGTIRFYDALKWECHWQINGLLWEPTALAFAPNGNSLTAVERGARRWDIATRKERLRILGDATWRQAKLSSDGRLVIRPLGDRVSVLDAVSGDERLKLKISERCTVQRVAISPNGEQIAITGPPDPARLIDLSSGQAVRAFGPPSCLPSAIDYSPDGCALVARGCGPKAAETIVYETATGGERLRIRLDAAEAAIVAFTLDGRLLATAGASGQVHLWSLITGQEFAHFDGHNSSVQALAFSPDSTILASGARDTTVLIWDTKPALERSHKAAKPVGNGWCGQALADLGSADARRAYRALWALVGSPEQAIPALHGLINKEHTPDRGRLKKLLSDLGSDDFDTRENATAELAKMGHRVEAALHRALKEKPFAEQRRRLGILISKLEGRTPSESDRQLWRGVEVLERIGSTAARQLLETFAADAQDMHTAAEAQAALGRLARLPKQ